MGGGAAVGIAVGRDGGKGLILGTMDWPGTAAPTPVGPNGNWPSLAARVGHRSLVLVVFIGGVTFAEIAALRFLSAQDGMGYDFLVATTKVVNGNTILRPIMANSKED
ncbi:hypothetical protein GUJ93_ZPchr0001g29401 [Zizania palustris]|uniref:Uncharacterized protein n=1 Tax=Zizania palustris TaxID=103762 RepID=A0A8J5RY82_ZIZPA|nr:hypothetical protein GUJ93_ZPchr0001g29401 [Zizania palustris]